MGIKLAATGAGALLLAAAAFAAGPASASETPKPKKERLICKSIEETGSVARRKRQCFTKVEWDRIAEAARARGQRLQSDMAGGLSGN